MAYKNVLYPYDMSTLDETIVDMQSDMNVRLRKTGHRVHTVLDLGHAFLVVYAPSLD